MSPGDSFAELMGRLRAGDQAAETALWQRFARRLVGLARTHLDSRLRRKEDPEDVIQSVFGSFFVRYEAGQFAFDSWGDLWSLLTRITVCKCANRMKYFRAKCRDAGREVSPGGTIDLLEQVLDPEPTPVEAAILTETVERLLQEFSGDYRPILELSLQGQSVQQISEQLGWSERTVQRVREQARDWLRRAEAGCVSEPGADDEQPT